MVNGSSSVTAKLCLLALATSVPLTSAGFWSNKEDAPDEGVLKHVPQDKHDDWSDYGVDVSFPMHRALVEDKSTNPLGDRNTMYKEFLDSCRESFGAKGARCTR